MIFHPPPSPSWSRGCWCIPSAACLTEPSGPRRPKLVPRMFTHATAETQALALKMHREIDRKI